MRTSRLICLQSALIVDGTGRPAERGNLLFQHGKIIASGPDVIPPAEAVCIPMEGLYVSPGWMDLHTHVFANLGIFSIEPAEIGLQSGVTTLVDAGSAGALTLNSFVRHGVYEARERILAYVNVASAGLVHGHPAEPGYVGDHFHPSLHSVALAEAILKEFPEVVVGWKGRFTAILADDDLQRERGALEALMALRDRTGRPVMVHHVDSSIPPQELLERLQARDVFTHLYHGRGGSIFAEGSGKPMEAAWQARARGVLFDVGHGCGSFRWGIAEAACQEHGFWPDTISSDLHRYNLFWPVRDLATTMSKFLYLNASLESVIAMVTGNVLRALDAAACPTSLLAPSAVADLTLFSVESGSFTLPDASGEVRIGRERVLPLAVVREGVLSPCYGLRARAEMADTFTSALQAALSL